MSIQFIELWTELDTWRSHWSVYTRSIFGCLRYMTKSTAREQRLVMHKLSFEQWVVKEVDRGVEWY